MSAAPDIQHGKAFEKRVNAAFEKLYQIYPVRWERILDSGSAGNVVRNAESDYKFMAKSNEKFQPYLALIECKATVDPTKDFRSNFRRWVKSNQNASMHAYRRGGGAALIIFQRIARGRIEVWNGRLVNEKYGTLRSVIERGPAYDMPDTDDALFRWARALARDSHGVLHFIDDDSQSTAFIKEQL